MTLLKNISPLPVCFGGAALSSLEGGYGFGNVDDNQSFDALHYCFDSGVKIFDTAPIYGFGESERRLGQAFKGQREKIFIISKSGVSWHSNKRVNRTNDPETALKMFEQSLRDLDSDYIDLYMIHWPDENIDIRRPLEILHKLKTEEKIHHIGLCNTTLDDLKKASEIDRIEVVQSEQHFFNDQDEELMNYLGKEEISFLSWGTLDKGILTGTVTREREFEESDCRSHAPWWKTSHKDKKVYIMQKYILPFLKKNGHTGLELALVYNKSFKNISHLLCGGKTVKQWEGIFQAFDHLPSREILAECIQLRDRHL